MSLFARASAGFALSAIERTFLRFLKSLWLTVLLASLPVLSGLMNALSTNALTVDWNAWGTRLLAAVGTSLAFAIQKYFSAQGDGVQQQATPTTSLTSATIPEPPASTAPVSPSYAVAHPNTGGISIGPGSFSIQGMPVNAAPSTVTLNPTVSNLPPAADTPTLVTPVVPATTPSAT